jgi:formylglycine-generating enzyme required for sulfatase activity
VGGAQERRYPWGSQDPGTNNEYLIYGHHYANGSSQSPGVSNIAPVGTAKLGAGAWGQLDLLGDLEEWELDWYRSPLVEPCVDCAYLTQTVDKVTRGGAFFLDLSDSDFNPADREDVAAPTTIDATQGVRCARSP